MARRAPSRLKPRNLNGTMIEELTPQVLMSMLLLMMLLVPAITLPLSLLLLQRYRAAVVRAMQTSSGFAEPAPQPAGNKAAAPSPTVAPDRFENPALLRWLQWAPWRNSLNYLAAGLVFALTLSAAAQIVYPSGLGLPGYLLGVWIYLWPAFPAALLLTSPPARQLLLVLAIYLLVGALLVLLASRVMNIPELRFGAAVIPARSTVTPETIARLWLVVNGIPTALMLLCFNTWVRAVAALVLTVVTTACAGLLGVYLALFSPRGADLAVSVAVALDLHIYWLLAAVALVTLLLFAALGWLLTRWLSAAYRKRRCSDQMLLLDALWLFFAAYYSMWLAWGGAAWVLMGVLAFTLFKFTWYLMARISPSPPEDTVGLMFLRVFALGKRSLALFNRLSLHWRYAGTINLITGPDLARSTLQPHQFLDFLSGNLARHFVADAASLQRCLQERDRDTDPDGRFRINNFYCHEDSWQSLLPHLAEQGDRVLMDLRNYQSGNEGCSHEIRYLVQSVSFERCLLAVDSDTDNEALRQLLEETAAALPPAAVNYGKPVEQMRRLPINAARSAITPLLKALATARE